MEEVIGKTDWINFEMFKILFKNRAMIPGEINTVFNTADMKKQNKLDQTEWQSFFKVFIEPFEKCDEDKDYLLSQDEFGKCLESEELSPLRLKPEDTAMVWELINKDDENQVNFADYLYMRRVNIGWGDCAGGTIMSRIQIPCGMRVVVPGLIASEQDVKMIVEIVTAFKYGIATYAEPYLSL